MKGLCEAPGSARFARARTVKCRTARFSALVRLRASLVMVFLKQVRKKTSTASDRLTPCVGVGLTPTSSLQKRPICASLVKFHQKWPSRRMFSALQSSCYDRSEVPPGKRCFAYSPILPAASLSGRIHKVGRSRPWVNSRYQATNPRSAASLSTHV